MSNHKALLDNAETTKTELLQAYAELLEDQLRFQALLGPEATGSKLAGYVRKYGPTVAKYSGAAGGGAGILTVLGNVFPKVSAALGLGG